MVALRQSELAQCWVLDDPFGISDLGFGISAEVGLSHFRKELPLAVFSHTLLDQYA